MNSSVVGLPLGCSPFFVIIIFPGTRQRSKALCGEGQVPAALFSGARMRKADETVVHVD